MKYQSTKRFSGYSTCFRQWKADSHCKYLHGYSLEFKVHFEGDLDEKNWVIDFGGFKDIKEILSYMFDHTTIIAKDDPEIEYFKELNDKGLIQLRVIENVGCEKFAEWVYREIGFHFNNLRANIVSVECFENNNNSAIYKL